MTALLSSSSAAIGPSCDKLWSFEWIANSDAESTPLTDNNPAENALRGVVIGRKIWLFPGSDRGAKTAAVLYTFIASCQHHDVDPFTYVRDVLDQRLPDQRPRSILA